MLTLTENASTIVKTLVDQTPGSDDTGLRISSTNAENTAFSVGVADAPEPTDLVVESAGARVFLEPGAAVALDDKVLDAALDDRGSVSFAIGLAE